MNNTEHNLIALQIRLEVFAEDFEFSAERVAVDPRQAYLEKKFRSHAERCGRFAADIDLKTGVKPQVKVFDDLYLYLRILADEYTAVAEKVTNNPKKTWMWRCPEFCVTVG